MQFYTQVAVPDYGEQLDRMERNMDVLRQGLLAVAERQEVTMAAQAVTMEAVRVLGEQVGQVMYPVLDAPTEPPALPEARREPMTREEELDAYLRSLGLVPKKRHFAGA